MIQTIKYNWVRWVKPGNYPVLIYKSLYCKELRIKKQPGNENRGETHRRKKER